MKYLVWRIFFVSFESSLTNFFFSVIRSGFLQQETSFWFDANNFIRILFLLTVILKHPYNHQPKEELEQKYSFLI